MKDGPHTYGQCRFCTEYHFSYPAKRVEPSRSMLENALAAITLLHHADKNRNVLVNDDWGNPCCECEGYIWPCPTYDVAAQALGFEQLDA